MLDMEAKGSAKVADFQNFAKSFAFGDYTALMASTTANAASLAGAADLKGRMLDGRGLLRRPSCARCCSRSGRRWRATQRDPKRGVTILKTEYAGRLLAAPPETDRHLPSYVAVEDEDEPVRRKAPPRTEA